MRLKNFIDQNKENFLYKNELNILDIIGILILTFRIKQDNECQKIIRKMSNKISNFIETGV